MREEKALYVLPAIGRSTADATNVKGVVRIATTTSSAPHTLPKELRGCYCRVVSIGANTRYVFVTGNDSAPTLVYAQAAAFGTGHLAAGATLLDSIEQQFIVPEDATQLIVISDSASGFLEFHLTGRRK